MFNFRAAKASRLSAFSKSGTLLGLAGLALLTMSAAPKAFATTYHATSGYCQVDPGSTGADVQWNFVGNPSTSNPSTLVGISNYSYQFATGECFWSGFAPSGTIASSSAKANLSYQTIYSTSDSGTNPQGKAQIYVGTSSARTKYGAFGYHPPSGPQSNLTTSGSPSYTITAGDDLSQVIVETLVDSGNMFTSSMELDLEAVSITN